MLLHQWNSPGKNTGVGCHFLLQCRKVKSESEVAQLCPTNSVTDVHQEAKPLLDLYGRFPLVYLHFSLSILYFLPSSLSLSILSHSLLIYLFFYYPFTQKIFLPSFLSLFHQSNPFLFQAFFLITGKIISPVNIRRTILSNYNFHLFTSSDYLPI